MLYLAIASMVLWLLILSLPWRPWLVNEKWEAGDFKDNSPLRDITVLVPARNEEQVIHQTMSAVLNQGVGLSVVVINDHSSDGTAGILENFENRVTVINSPPLPPGWTGKLWALEQGRLKAETPLILLLDADIELKPGVISGLRQLIADKQKDMVSLLAKPALETVWERMLMPAFVYYFKLLYPFSLANSDNKYVAAAAGGCIMIKKKALDGIGGFRCIGNALIDDCRLAKEIKRRGFTTWLGLTHSIRSVRPYQGLTEIWNMVARTAYTQLNHSIFLLLLCSGIMVLAYFVPIIALVFGRLIAVLGAATLLIMYITYLPVLGYYQRSWLWAPLMPLTAGLFLGMTWTSAFRHWNGAQVRWRGRAERMRPVEQ